MKFLLAPLLFVLILQQSNCGLDIEESNSYFNWVEVGNQLTYNLRFGDIKIQNYRKIEITESTGRESKFFQEVSTEIADDPFGSVNLSGIFHHVYRLNDGLHTTRCFSCGINPCLSVKNHLKIPSVPSKGQRINDFRCGDEVFSTDIIISVDSTIIVPLGSFKTFVIKDTLNRNIKFWNEKIGLIRVDNYNELFSDTVILELSSKNY